MKISVERIELVLKRCLGEHHSCPLNWDEAFWLIKEIKIKDRKIKKLKKQLSVKMIQSSSRRTK